MTNRIDTPPLHHHSAGAPRAVQVAVAIVRDSSGRALLCRRAETARYGGRWEFPGGKLEPGETPLDALRRELREELSIECDHARPFHRAEAAYADGGTFV